MSCHPSYVVYDLYVIRTMKRLSGVWTAWGLAVPNNVGLAYRSSSASNADDPVTSPVQGACKHWPPLVSCTVRRVWQTHS